MAAVPDSTDLLPPSLRAVALQSRNTLALRAEAAVLRVFTAPEQVAALGRHAAQGARGWVLGGGSNLVLPASVAGEVWQMALRGITLEDETREHWLVRAAGGEPWHEFVAACVARGWGGLENLALIPGTVGAAPVQNIGAYGLELAERVHSVEAYEIPAKRWRRLAAAECGFGYRDSRFKRAAPGHWMITAVTFALPRRWQPRLDYPDLRRWPGWEEAPPKPETVFDAVCAIRRAKLPDPARLPNAGSFFKNPIVPAAQAAALRERHPGVPAWPQTDGGVKLAAAWLIEQAGWKGRRLGPVGMHERHALVLVNHGDAVGDDVLRLAGAVQADVRIRFGVTLEIEPVRIADALGDI
ncbi:MAG: UDP-N-acetylmuramate dehydrogenase [Pigmentiphaga sp.]|nr:UDP-N-acetylmuramate dehydrogenase [Pigmentiphaga sp.]